MIYLPDLGNIRPAYCALVVLPQTKVFYLRDTKPTFSTATLCIAINVVRSKIYLVLSRPLAAHFTRFFGVLGIPLTA